VGGLGNAYRLYEVDGKQLVFLKAKVVRVQDVIDREGWEGDDADDADDDDEHEGDGGYLVWREVPKIAVVEVHFNGIKPKRLQEVRPVRSRSSK
jgi:hypothetical protein